MIFLNDTWTEGPAGRDDPRDDDPDYWRSDEWWREIRREEGPIRGLLFALPISALMWLAMATTVWFIFAA